MPNRNEAKTALDTVIRKSRVHLYKPIQIAEILYHDRVVERLDLLNLEAYRNKSKHWRDEICRVLHWGPAIQIKHLSLNEELAENIVDGVSSDRIVIVCKDAEQKIIVSLLTQIGWKSRIQSVVTESDLVDWYDKALRGAYSGITGTELLGRLRAEILKEFPSLDDMPEILKARGYDTISDEFWV